MQTKPNQTKPVWCSNSDCDINDVHQRLLQEATRYYCTDTVPITWKRHSLYEWLNKGVLGNINIKQATQSVNTFKM